ncbi:MAG: pseudaminic acid cytidylyltransferase [Bacteroidota bacterium]
MRRLAIIPARGGSKRIPRKNIRPFLGKPIIAYSIEKALESGLFDEVMVSTDDPEIAAVAKHFGAEVPFLRSSVAANDHATTVDVLIEVLEQYEQYDLQFDEVCCWYPTAPFTTIEHLRSAFELMAKHDFDCVFPVMAFSYPIQRALRRREEAVTMFQPKYQFSRSQDLETAYHDCGLFYCFQQKRFQQSHQLWTAHTGAIILSEMEAHDIDTEEDWKVAEFKYRLLQEQFAATAAASQASPMKMRTL